ncbi:MAG: DNA primase [Bacteroidota bacterium]|nr:DNA primase [Bacteroidota bacterium]
MAIPPEIIEEIRQRADIVSIIGQYVQLRPRGKNYVGLCPFHAEKTPSFNVSPQLGIYKCFGCGKSGDVFTFLREYAGWTFVEAVQQIASQLGISLPEQQHSATLDHRRTLIAVLAAARDFYRHTLTISKEAQSFFLEREFEASTVERFQLGYAPPLWTALRDTLLAQGYTAEQLIEAGVVVPRDDGSSYDRFRNRIMFPIWNMSGEVIAFAGRTLSTDADEPKYINTPQTTLYDKSSVLYAIHFAKHAILRQRQAVIVEGYTDAIALHKAGIEHSVATCGTALTQRHLEVLRRLADTIILVFDGDSAGVNAAYRAVRIALEGGFSVEIVLLPSGEDPDSIVRSRGTEKMREILSRRLSPVEFLLTWSKQQYDWSNHAVAARQIRYIAETISTAADPIYRELLMRELSDRVGVRTELLGTVASTSTQPNLPMRRLAAEHVNEHSPSPKGLSTALPIYPEEVALLQIVLYSHDAARLLFEDYLFDPTSMVSEQAQRLMTALATYVQEHSAALPPGHALPALALDDQTRQLAEWLVFSYESPSERWAEFDQELNVEQMYRKILDDAITRLEERRLTHQIDQLSQQLKHQPDNLELLRQIDRLHKLRIQLRSGSL